MKGWEEIFSKKLIKKRRSWIFFKEKCLIDEEHFMREGRNAVIGQRRPFLRLLARFGWNNNIGNVHITIRNSYDHWRTSFTELISLSIISKFAQFCLHWLEGFTHLVRRFFTSLKTIMPTWLQICTFPMHFVGINSFLTGPVIVSNKNWNIPIKWGVIIAFWNSAIICRRDTPSFLPFVCWRELCLLHWPVYKNNTVCLLHMLVTLGLY